LWCSEIHHAIVKKKVGILGSDKITVAESFMNHL